MGQRELEGDEHRGGERRELTGPLRRGTSATTSASTTARTSTAGCRKPRSGIPVRGTGPSPRSRTANCAPPGTRSSAPRTSAAASQSDGSSRRIEKAATVATRNAAANRSDAAHLQLGYVAQSGATRRARTSSSPQVRPLAPRAQSDVDEPEAEEEEGGHDRVVRVRVQRVRGERVRGPARTRAPRPAASRRIGARPGRARGSRAGRTRSTSRAPQAASPTSRSSRRSTSPGTYARYETGP